MNFPMIFCSANFRHFHKMQLITRYLVLFFFLFSNICFAQTIPSRPNPPRLVNDFANVLSPSEEQALERKLVAFDDSTSTQVAVITITSLQGYTIEETAHKFLRDWGVGRKEKNNGVVILASIEDRKINIQTGLGMEGVLPDLICKRIITQHIIPAFKQQHYFEGFDNATTKIIQISKNEYTNDGNSGEGDISGVIIFAVMIIIFLFIIIMARRSKQKGTVMTRRGYTNWDGGGWWYLPGGGGNSSWGDDDNNRGGGGFDFGGFGGGDGGGGGASGDW
jgi:uncharacterized protein